MEEDVNINDVELEVPSMAVMAKPSKGSFIVSGNDMDRIKNEKMSKPCFEQIKTLAEKFDKNNLKKD